MRRFIVPLILTLAFYAESIFVDLVPTGFLGEERTFLPHFLLTLLIIMGIYYIRNHALLYAALFGLLYDVYYTETIGIYLYLYPIATYLGAKMAQALRVNVFTTAIVLIIHLTLVDLLVYAFHVLIFRVGITPNEFAILRLIPSLALNLVFFILIFFPISRFLQTRKKEVLDAL